MRFTRNLLLTLALAFGASAALARDVVEATPFAVTDFGAFEKVEQTCGGPTPSFLCGQEGESFYRIAGKGVDYFFTPAGELAGAYTKQQRGQVLNNYAVDAQTNLIPYSASAPGLALLIDGEYVHPADAQGGWMRDGDVELSAEYSARYVSDAGEFEVLRTIELPDGSDSLLVSIEVTRVSEGEPVVVQLATPGIGRSDAPVVKLGYGETFILNPTEQAVQLPTYVSLQQNNNNRGFAVVQTPLEGSSAVEAAYVRPNFVAFQAELGGAAGDSVTIGSKLYAGHNELVRYHQEGLLGLEGMFKPNILGRLSLLVVQLLEFIHQFVPNWGLSIIVLTLLFRAVVWPLITTQTKSMYGMQALQPKMKELQGKYKDDREKLQQETMALYKEAGVNPAGGCLPMLLQMPLFIILWRVFVNFEFNEGFLWLPDLGRADPFYILPILYVLVMLGTSYFSARGNPQTLKQSMLINVVFVFIIINFPAGVLLYYVVSMLVQVFQYWLISRDQPALAGAGGLSLKPAGAQKPAPKTSGNKGGSSKKGNATNAGKRSANTKGGK